MIYREPYYMDADTKIKLALAEFEETKAAFAVVK